MIYEDHCTDCRPTELYIIIAINESVLYFYVGINECSQAMIYYNILCDYII